MSRGRFLRNCGPISTEKFKLLNTQSRPFSAYTTVNKHRCLASEYYHHSKGNAVLNGDFSGGGAYTFIFYISLSRGHRNSVPQPGIEPMLPALEM